MGCGLLKRSSSILSTKFLFSASRKFQVVCVLGDVHRLGWISLCHKVKRIFCRRCCGNLESQGTHNKHFNRSSRYSNSSSVDQDRRYHKVVGSSLRLVPSIFGDVTTIRDATAKRDKLKCGHHSEYPPNSSNGTREL